MCSHYVGGKTQGSCLQIVRVVFRLSCLGYSNVTTIKSPLVNLVMDRNLVMDSFEKIMETYSNSAPFLNE